MSYFSFFCSSLSGPGNDYIQGGDDDNPACYSGKCGLFGEEGDDEIHGGAGMDYISGGSGNDLIYGGGGNDSLNGDEGDDTLNGGAGDDEAFGGVGKDLCIGGLGNDKCDGGDPYTETIAEDEDLCDETTETKISCRGPGQPEFYELTFNQKVTGPDTNIVMEGKVTFEYSQSAGLYNTIGGLMNLNMRPDPCVSFVGTYRPIRSKQSLFLTKSKDEYGKNLNLTIFGIVTTEVISSIMTDSCEGETMKNFPASMPGPVIGNYKEQSHLVFNQNSLNIINHHQSGPIEGAWLDLTFSLKAKGRLFPEAGKVP